MVAIPRRSSLLLVLCATLLLAGCHRGPVEQAGPGALTFVSVRAPFPWALAVNAIRPGLAVNPGRSWSLAYDLEVDLRNHGRRYGRFTQLILAAQGLLRHDAGGYYKAGTSSLVLSSNFTTTGIPVERFDGWPELALLHGKNGSPFEGVKTFPLPRGELDRRHRFKGRLSVRLPASLARGHYQVRLMVYARVQGVPDPVLLENYGDNSNTQDRKVLPLIAVGKPAPPRLPWTILSPLHGGSSSRGFYRGQPGALPLEEQGRVGLCGRSGFPSELILPPGHYNLAPSFPSIFPVAAMPPVSGGLEVFSEEEPSYLRFDRGQASCSIQGPNGEQHLGSRKMVGKGSSGPMLQGNSFPANMSRTGTYHIKLQGHIEDTAGRRFVGGGSYRVHVARPLSFSTSCKPGSSFLVGDRYPAKVNVNPPFPAQVEVVVDYYPNSELARRKRWTARGRANRFGHYVPSGPAPWAFDEPGEYRSRVTATFRDGRGTLWMGKQTSAGVIAPRQRTVLALHGTRSFPYDYKVDRPFFGGARRFADRKPLTLGFLPFRPSPLPDVFAPHDPRDTLFISASGFNENLVEPHLSMALRDETLSRLIQQGNRMASTSPPPLLQPRRARWLYLRDVVKISADSAAWFPADRAHADELPVKSIGGGKYHPFAYPSRARVEAYIYMGVVRPGFPVMTTVLQSEALGLYWLASPNPFGHHFGAGSNGDLAGDVYRIQAGAMLLDRRTGERHYDAYSAAIAVVKNDGKATAILPPGERPLVILGDRKHHIFLATDTHDALDAGERMGFGGMVFPAVQADVSWTITRPSGQQLQLAGKANRLGIVRGGVILADLPGIYRVKVRVRHGKLRGDVVGTQNGSYWHCVLTGSDPGLLRTTLGTRTRVHAQDGVKIPLSWPRRLEQVKLHYAVLMPGQVLDQGIFSGANDWSYHYHPAQMTVQYPNLDARDYGSGIWQLADTVIFQFFLEGLDNGVKVYDSLRLVLRAQELYNYEALIKTGAHGGHRGGRGPGPGHPGQPQPKEHP